MTETELLHNRVLDLINSFVRATGAKPSEISFGKEEEKIILNNILADGAIAQFSDHESDSNLKDRVEYYMGLKVIGWDSKLMEIK